MAQNEEKKANDLCRKQVCIFHLGSLLIGTQVSLFTEPFIYFQKKKNLWDFYVRRKELLEICISLWIYFANRDFLSFCIFTNIQEFPKFARLLRTGKISIIDKINTTPLLEKTSNANTNPKRSSRSFLYLSFYITFAYWI